MWQCHLSAQDHRYYPVDGYSLLKRLPSQTLSAPRCPVQTVGQWLENIGLPQYENHLLANGFDHVQFMGSNVMEDQDLLEIGILNSGHRQRILQAIQLLPKVEKNDDIDQKIEQDGIKPEDKAHKAATKIQASFRGHITRKKLKGEKKGDAQTDVEAGEKKEEVLANGLADGKPAITEVAPVENALPADGSKGGSTPADEKQGDTGSEQPAPKATTPAASSEEKPAPATTESESATKASTDNSPSLKAEEAQVKEEPKQADVPATVTTAVTPTAAEDATAKATAQPQTDTAESSQTEEKTDAVEETKPSESAQQEEAKDDECKADQENA